MAILLAFAVLAMFLSPVFGMAPAALRTSHSSARLVANFALLALFVIARGTLFLRASTEAGRRSPATKPPFPISVPLSDLDCVRLC